MGYRMEYGTGEHDAVFRKVGNGKKRVWVAAAIAVILLVTCYFQRDNMVDLLLPGDPEITRKAIGVFVSELKDGERATDAFEAFCRVIVDEANIS